MDIWAAAQFYNSVARDAGFNQFLPNKYGRFQTRGWKEACSKPGLIFPGLLDVSEFPTCVDTASYFAWFFDDTSLYKNMQFWILYIYYDILSFIIYI